MMRDIELDLPGAIASQQLEVWFQPQVNIMSGEVAGLEALLRWNHPVRGWISPPEIVAAAFRLRISNSLTAFVLEQACRKIRDLTASGHGEVRVAINISPRELVQYDVARLVKKSILEHGVSPDRLEIEITEETIANSAMALATFDSLTKFGIRIAIDDFGIGFSSITYLRTMQIHQIKIDRSFVSSIATNPRDRIIVRTIIGLGQSFGLDVIAEGVETQEEAEILQTLGCRTLQGFYIADPMSSSKLSDWLRAPKMSLALSEAAA